MKLNGGGGGVCVCVWGGGGEGGCSVVKNLYSEIKNHSSLDPVGHGHDTLGILYTCLKLAANSETALCKQTWLKFRSQGVLV